MKHLKLYEGYINDFYDRHTTLYKHTSDRKIAIRKNYQSQANQLKWDADREIDNLENEYTSKTREEFTSLSKHFPEILFTLIEDYNLYPQPFFNPKIDTEVNKGNNKFYIGYKFANESGVTPITITDEFITELNRANKKLNHMGMFIYMVYTDVDSPSRCSLEDLIKYKGMKAQTILIAEI